METQVRLALLSKPLAGFLWLRKGVEDGETREKLLVFGSDRPDLEGLIEREGIWTI